ncbi:MAG: long-chain fatty acid--CoA ligase [Bacteroidales bacterium]|jgi:long-chain acyl-CoA synthetase|nr:long-chain fatty acid--CoA ligase [Bacteroidales bacterium]
MEVTRTFDILERLRQNFMVDDALAVKRNKKWDIFSTQEYLDNAYDFAYGLLALGYKKGEKIGTVSNNRPEWNFVDMGMAMAGIVHVPVYPTISDVEYEYILAHSEVKTLLISDKLLYKRLVPLAAKVETIKNLYVFNEGIEGVKSWTEIRDLGTQNRDKYKAELETIKASINPEDMVTIIYTSGTTGNAKGVMLSHHNLVSNAIATSKIQPLVAGERALSFLPLCHVYERMLNYHFQYKGIKVYYAENMATIVDNLKEINPHGFSSVPRLLEKVFDKIMAKGKDLEGIKKKIFFWAVDLGLRYELNNANGWAYAQKLKIARKLIFSKWQDALGGNVKVIISGGAALQPRLARVFRAAGINVQEGYGLTETSPVIAVNHTEYPDIKFGTVGPILEDVEVMIAEDGEILTKGPHIMLGYYKAPDLTAEVIDEEGWFHTGDIGIIEDGKYLKITDRKKEIFKLSSGKYVAPQSIENFCKESMFIENVMVIGENEKFASALISPDFNHLHFWATKHKLHYRDNEELVRIPDVVKRFQKEINEINKKIGETERIKRFRLVCSEWTPATGELSPTLKLKRKFLYDKYDHIVKEIFMSSKGE